MARDLKKLISEMTLEEKAGLCSGADFWHTKAVERLGIPAVMVSDALTDCVSRTRKVIISESTTALLRSAFRQPVQRHPALTRK
jgi:hypothetical protein